MYFKIKDNIMFRKYNKYGYLTDNSMFGYRLLDDNRLYPGEKYVSESGAIMLECLSKKPQHIDNIVGKLFKIFVDIDYDELKSETILFFSQFVDAGFLSCGETVEDCKKQDDIKLNKLNDETKTIEKVENCSKNIFSENDFLRSVHIEIANKCNERCVHCYIPHELKTETIDANLFYKILNEAKKLNVINVTLSGGEPLLHKDILGFLKKCKELDMSVNILTNLTLLTDEIINEIKSNPLISVQTSIYSMDSNIHDSITKMKGSFKKTKNALLKLKKFGVPIQISCPIMKQNKDTFIDVVKWGNENGILVLTDYVIFAAYDHSNCNLTNRLSLEEVGSAIDKQMTVNYARELCATATEKESLGPNDPVCSICRYNFCVSAEGDVFPCVGWQSNVIGNLNVQSMKEIWKESQEIKRLRHVQRAHFPKCISCKDRGYCTICMMGNSNENGDAFKVNDFHCAVSSMMHDKVKKCLNGKTFR